jgi:hypothetical protein
MAVYEPIEGERWAKIEGFDYEVSDLGRVRGFRHRGGKPGILQTRPDKEGYHMAALCRDGALHYKKAHRLVAKAFCPERPGANQVNHKNGIKWDNHYANLEWVTNHENIRHARDVTKCLKRGARSKKAKFTQEQANAIHDRYWAGGTSMGKLAKEHGVCAFTIHQIVHRRRYQEAG